MLKKKTEQLNNEKKHCSLSSGPLTKETSGLSKAALGRGRPSRAKKQPSRFGFISSPPSMSVGPMKPKKASLLKEPVVAENSVSPKGLLCKKISTEKIVRFTEPETHPSFLVCPTNKNSLFSQSSPEEAVLSQRKSTLSHEEKERAHTLSLNPDESVLQLTEAELPDDCLKMQLFQQLSLKKNPSAPEGEIKFISNSSLSDSSKENKATLKRRNSTVRFQLKFR